MRIVVFGAGIAGLTAAHYLVQRGHRVTVVEKLSVPGGLARSERTGKNLPIEYSWRGFGPWYHNAYDVLREISDNGKTAFDNLEPVHFSFLEPHKISNWDWVKMFWLIIRSAAASPKRQDEYAAISAKEVLAKTVSPTAAHDASWVLGPWVGTDAGHASYHHSAQFFQHNTFPGISTYWSAGHVQKSNSPWMITTKPTNEAWFDPWVKQLKSQGVQFYWNSEIVRFNNWVAQVKIEGATRYLPADYYVLAINPFMAHGVLQQSNGVPIQSARALSEPHRQISFRVVFTEPLQLPPLSAYILLDSPFDITFYNQQASFLQPWYKSLWSGTATLDTQPGFLGKPMSLVTKEEMITEIRQQLLASGQLQSLVQKFNKRSLGSYQFDIELWPTWQFPPETSSVQDPTQPKWVNDTHNRPYQPVQQLGKVILAGAHVKTTADLYSMEGAVESGRKAADLITGMDTVVKQHVPWPLAALRKGDRVCKAVHLPNIVDVLLFSLIIIIIVVMVVKIFK